MTASLIYLCGGTKRYCSGEAELMALKGIDLETSTQEILGLLQCSVFMLALRSVRRNMLRSFLAILGIVIGISAVITMGALEGKVLLQFLIEAVAMSALGGIVGVLIAAAASYALSLVMEVPYVFDATINLLALVFSSGIGVVFGYFPARHAAQMDPIEALRHE